MKTPENDSNAARPLTRRPTRYRIVKKVAGVCIFEVVGRLAPTNADEELCTRIDGIIASGSVNFLIDLGGVNYISSTGVGSLIQCYHHAERAGGKLKILHPSQAVAQILTVSKLDSVFEMFSNEDIALRSFQTDGGHPAAVEAAPEANGREKSPEKPSVLDKPLTVEAFRRTPPAAPARLPSAPVPPPPPVVPQPASAAPSVKVVKAADTPPLKKPRTRKAKSS
jgi:anti-sigma B factor antagonist